MQTFKVEYRGFAKTLADVRIIRCFMQTFAREKEILRSIPCRSLHITRKNANFRTGGKKTGEYIRVEFSDEVTEVQKCGLGLKGGSEEGDDQGGGEAHEGDGKAADCPFDGAELDGLGGAESVRGAAKG